METRAGVCVPVPTWSAFDPGEALCAQRREDKCTLIKHPLPASVSTLPEFIHSSSRTRAGDMGPSASLVTERTRGTEPLPWLSPLKHSDSAVPEERKAELTIGQHPERPLPGRLGHFECISMAVTGIQGWQEMMVVVIFLSLPSPTLTLTLTLTH